MLSVYSVREILVERNGAERKSIAKVFLFFLKGLHCKNTSEVKTMEVLEKRPHRPADMRTNRSENKHSANVDYNGELRSWVQHAILEAKRNRNSEKKNQLQSLLKEL